MALPTASDNVFPKLKISEGSSPGSAAASQQNLYIDSADHKLKRINSSGVITILDPTSLANPGAELDYVEYTTTVTVTATAEASATSIVAANAVSFDGSTSVFIEFFCPRAETAAAASAFLALYLYDGSSSIGQIGFVGTGSASGSQTITPVLAKRKLTPSNASHTYSIRGIQSAGNAVARVDVGGSGHIVPGYIRITKA